MKKIPVQIVELTSPSGKKAIDVMIDIYDYNEIEKGQEKIKQFKKKYFEYVKRAEKLFYGDDKPSKKRTDKPSSTYWQLGTLLQKFNKEIKNEFEITNYTEAISRDFALSKDYHYDIFTILQIFKKDEILDSVPFSYYRALKRKRSDLKKLGLFEQEIKRLNKLGINNKLPGRENYKIELINIIKKAKKNDQN